MDDSEVDVDDDDDEEEEEEEELMRTRGPRQELSRPSRRARQTELFVEHDSDF